MCSPSTWSPKVCEIMAFEAIFGGLWAIVLHTFGVQVVAINTRGGYMRIALKWLLCGCLCSGSAQNVVPFVNFSIFGEQ